MKTYKKFSPRTLPQSKPFISSDYQSLIQIQQSELKACTHLGTQIPKGQRVVTNRQSEDARFAELGKFSTMIVHEVRNPLTTILMSLQSFQNLNLPEIFQLRLDFALDEADRLQRLVNEILLYTKPQKLSASSLDIDALIINCIEGFQAMPSAVDKKLTFIPTSVPVEIQGNSDKLKQVLINLLTNACEASRVGDEINIQLLHQEQSVCIKVHNWGESIPTDQVVTVLQPFYSTKSTGNGLGLPIVKRIVDEHGGYLRINSDPQSGTTVSVELPIGPK
ncbi:sensor histidine kinase [Acaryochloris marina NIES-2412]|uniref:sensor histidine kinase n=1 Tax=Acaryochloris marina TaxID=155978 RepID=UPI00405A31D9